MSPRARSPRSASRRSSLRATFPWPPATTTSMARSLPTGSGPGQAEPHARPAPRVGEPDLAAVRLHDRATDGQAEPGAVAGGAGGAGAAAVEGLERPLAVFGRESLAGVRDLDFDRHAVRLRGHGHAAVGGRMANRVLDQV